VGIKQDEAGNPTVCKKSSRFGGKDVRIDDFDGGKFISPSAPDAQRLASGWKGCSQAASQATNEYSHPSVSDRKELPEALRKIVKQLQIRIYQKAGKGVPDYPLSIR